MISNITASTSISTPSDVTASSDQPKKRGPDSWLKGSKLAYLTSLHDEWKIAQKSGSTYLGTFYDRVATQWIYMYGYDLPLNEDNPNHNPIPTTGLDRVPFLEGQPESVVAARDAYWKALRQKIYRWFYGRKSIKKSDIADGLEDLLTQIQTVGKSSRKQSAYQYYQKHYWDSRIAPFIAPALEAAHSNALQKGNELTPKLKKSIRMTVYQEVAHARWVNDSKDPTFKAKVESETAATNSRAETGLDTQPQTAEDYADALKTAGPVLHAIAQSLGKKYGMVVSILMAGPIGEDDGKIGIRSYHFGETTTRVKATWPDFNKPAYSATMNDFSKFAMSVFTPEECKARALTSIPPDISSNPATPNPTTSLTLPSLDSDVTLEDSVRPNPATGNDETEIAISSSGTHGPSSSTVTSDPEAHLDTPSINGPLYQPMARAQSFAMPSSNIPGPPPSSLPASLPSAPSPLVASASIVPPRHVSPSFPIPSSPSISTSSPSIVTPTPPSASAPLISALPSREFTPSPGTELSTTPHPPSTFTPPGDPLGKVTTVARVDPQSQPSPLTHSPETEHNVVGSSTLTAVEDTDIPAQDKPFEASAVNPAHASAVSTIRPHSGCSTLPPNDDLTVSLPTSTMELRRSSRVKQPTERARGLSKPNPSQSPIDRPSVPLVDLSLLQMLPQDLIPSYSAIVSTATLDADWCTCINRWLVVESQSRQVVSQQLRTSLRPVELSTWLREGRPSAGPSDGIDPVMFGAALHAWWVSLQPVHRGDKGDLRPSDIPLSEWKAVKKFHRFGFSLIMFGLSWWGKAVVKSPADTSPHLESWRAMVNDVDWVLQQWVGHFPAITRRDKREATRTDQERPFKRTRK